MKRIPMRTTPNPRLAGVDCHTYDVTSRDSLIHDLGFLSFSCALDAVPRARCSFMAVGYGGVGLRLSL